MAGTIHPIRASVRPRVFSPETGDAIPLESLLPEVERVSARAIAIIGCRGSGKTTALAHLAALLPPDHKVVLLDDPSPEPVAEAPDDARVVFTSLCPHPAPGTVGYHLVPWGNDDLVEYLLAAHPAECSSVIARLAAAPDRQLARGLPELWRIVLDRMAEDDSLRSVSEALRRELQQGLPGARLYTMAGQYCLADLMGRAGKAAKYHRLLQQSEAEPSSLRLLRHDAVRHMLAGDRLAQLLESRSGCDWLGKRLPRDLVMAVATVASARALQNLRKWIAEGPVGCQPMAASLIHAADAQWVPDPNSLPLLVGAYLESAAWKGANLSGAMIAGSDLSNAELSEAVLDGAMAVRTDFRGAVLHRATMDRLLGGGANFATAVLTSINARFAKLGEAVLCGADLLGACLYHADLRGANLTDARLGHTDLTYADLRDALIDRADFSFADLTGARLNELALCNAQFTGAIFAEADMRNCVLEGMDLPDGDFSGANLDGALLTGSRMPRANLAGASLQRAGLADVCWEDADLRDADLRDCTFRLGSSRSGLVGSPIASEGSRTGFYGDEYDQQIYRPPEEVRKANLRGADLRGARLAGTDFYLVDLRGAKYTRSQLEHLQRCGAILCDRE